MTGMLAWRKVTASFETGSAPALPAAPRGDEVDDGILMVVVGVTISVDPAEVVEVLVEVLVEVFVEVFVEVLVVLALRQELSALPATVIVPLHASSPAASSSESST